MTSRPEHLGGPEWNEWGALFTPGDIFFIPARTFGYQYQNIFINDKLVGCLEPRQPYCDRGRWSFKCELPDINGADSFPRYYFDETRAKCEIISFFNWRLWRRVVS